MKLSISVRQTIYILIASLFCGLLSSSFQTYYGLQKDNAKQAEIIALTVDLHRDTLGNAVYILDKEQAGEILSSMVRQPLIKKALLIDDFSELLGVKTRENSYSMSRQLQLISDFMNIPQEQSYKIMVGSKDRFAVLTIAIDESVLANELSKTVMLNFGVSILFTIFLTLILVTLSYFYISKPVIKIAQWVNSLSNKTTHSPLPYIKDDELGLLVNRFNKEWRANQSASQKLSDMLDNLQKSERFSRLLMANSSDAMFLCHEGTKIHLVNNRAEKLTGISATELVGKNLGELSQLYSDSELEHLFKQVASNEIQGYEDKLVSNLGIEGSGVYLECRAAPIIIDNDTFVMVNARDDTEKKLAQKKIHELAYFDALTGLANRSLFSEQIENKIQEHKASNRYGALIYFDLDQFKKINDSLGHAVGDRVLVEIAAKVRDMFGINALCGRIGGDEFVIGLLNLADNVDYAAEQALEVSNALLLSISEPIECEGMTLHTTGSIGLAFFPDENIDGFELIRRADTAMYKAKSLGRNRIQFFKREMQYAAQNLLELEEGIHEALNNDQLEVWLQPQVNANKVIFGGEILVRWNHPERGLLSPPVFIPYAEECGLIIDIDKWVLKESIVQLTKWKEEESLGTIENISINVSPTFFLQVDFVSYVLGLLDKYQLPGELINLEITENLLLNNFELAKNKMLQLKNKGLSFSIDDFGTGYSSLKYLKELPLDELKIDRSFVNGLTDGSETHSIVEVVVTMAKNLNMDVIAEGVETQEQLDLLIKLGCYNFQGYFSGYPQPLAEFKHLVRNEEGSEILK
ncbi:EAL domain-containing protein [Aliivibrio kagoshimensis]|uniref:sensor domain-containing protein n=1 Tax=Aliivibrio kagoshimensis TaxID=2910230 RepID=UPI003D0C64F4